MTIENEEDLRHLKAIGRIVYETLILMSKQIEVGMTTLELDQLGKQNLEKYGANSAPMVTYDFPGYTCISVNEEAAHGIPGERKIAAGDVVNIDVSAELNGYFGDTGGTFLVPPVAPRMEYLCQSTRKALRQAMTIKNDDMDVEDSCPPAQNKPSPATMVGHSPPAPVTSLPSMNTQWSSPRISLLY